MKSIVASVAFANLATWWSPPPGQRPDLSDNPAVEAVGQDEPILKARSEQGAPSTTELEEAGDQTVIFWLAADGTAHANEWLEYSVDGRPLGTELATLKLDEIATDAVRQKFEGELGFLELSDDLIRTELERAAQAEAQKCPTCTHEFAGDVSTMAIAFAHQDQRI